MLFNLLYQLVPYLTHMPTCQTADETADNMAPFMTLELEALSPNLQRAVLARPWQPVSESITQHGLFSTVPSCIVLHAALVALTLWLGLVLAPHSFL